MRLAAATAMLLMEELLPELPEVLLASIVTTEDAECGRNTRV